MPIVISFGFLGNCLSFLVVLRKKYRRLSCSWYMGALSLSDNAMLIMGIFYYVKNLNGPTLTWSECIVGAYFMYTFSFIGEFLVIAMTIDRGIAINFPFKASIYCTASRARNVIGSIVILGLLLNIPHLFITSSDPICVAYAKDNLATRIYTWASVITYSVVPFAIICGLNCSIVYRLKQQQKQLSKKFQFECHMNDSTNSLQTNQSTSVNDGTDSLKTNQSTSVNDGTDSLQTNPSTSVEELPSICRDEPEIALSPIPSSLAKHLPPDVLKSHAAVLAKKSQTGKTGRQTMASAQSDALNNRSERDRQITKTLVLVSSIFLILTLPQYIRLVAFHYLDIYESPERYALFSFSHQLSRVMFVTNSAVNFYIYILSAAKFRHDLKHLFQVIWDVICCRRGS